MSRWKTSYDSQQLIQCAQNALTALESIKVEGMSQADLAEYSRLLKILKVLVTRFSKLDPELLSLNAWSNFPSWLNEARSQIMTFGQNRGIGHLQNANNNV